MPAIADTGFVVALSNRKDKHHAASLAVHRQTDVIFLPQTVLAEVGYMLTRQLGNLLVAQFLFTLPQTKYRLLALDQTDLNRAAILLRQYHDSRLDFVDATVIAAAERLNIKRVLTVDKRDFQMVRPSHVEAFELLP